MHATNQAAYLVVLYIPIKPSKRVNFLRALDFTFLVHLRQFWCNLDANNDAMEMTFFAISPIVKLRSIANLRNA